MHLDTCDDFGLQETSDVCCFGSLFFYTFPAINSVNSVNTFLNLYFKIQILKSLIKSKL